ncbi:MAG TPA: AMP-binding protein [Paenalcaligenes sp.]|nr:AMP-binding protein [Paenalcaligenes sp.]
MHKPTVHPWHALYAPTTPACIRPLLGQNLVQVLDECCQRYATRPSLYSMGGQLTFAQLQGLSHDFAQWLLARGLQPGERVALMMPNLMQYVVAMLGVLRAGGVVATCNPLYTVRELRLLFEDAQPRYVVIARPFATTAIQAITQSAQVNFKYDSSPELIITELGDLQSTPRRYLINALAWLTHARRRQKAQHRPDSAHHQGSLPKQSDSPPLPSQTHRFMQVLRQGARQSHDTPQIAATDPAFLLYTGGTTGHPKGVVLTHQNMVANIHQVSSWLMPTLKAGQETVLTALPMYHVFSLLGNCLLFLYLGGSNVLIADGRDMGQIIGAMRKYPISAFTGVNTLFRRLLQHPQFQHLDFSHFRVVIGGGAAVEESVATHWEAVTGQTLLQAYGLTETAPAVCINPLKGNHQKAALGLPLPSTEVQILDEQGLPLPLHTCGEICVRGPQVMAGYHRADDNEGIFTDDGFFRTGDMGYMDEQGFVYLQERKNDIINVSGFQVFPTEIEAVIGSLPEVTAVAVIGVPDADTGERIRAFIQLRKEGLAGDGFGAEQIRQHCQANLTKYKIPAEICFTDDLPLSPVGKVLRRKLRNKQDHAPD